MAGCHAYARACLAASAASACLLCVIGKMSSPATTMETKLYWQEGIPTAGSGTRKRFEKVYKKHSGLQLVEVMHDKERDATQLYLDRALQLTSYGEHMYHEMMAHVPLNTLVTPAKDVLVIGAGDGGVTLRVLLHPSVERVVQVELDQAVVNVSRRFFPELAKAYDDPRVDLKIQDAIAWAISQSRSGATAIFDAVIIDSTDDPIGSPWTKDFYEALRALLRPHGVLMQNVQNLDAPGQLTKLLNLHQAGGFEAVRPILISTIDYSSPYIAYLSAGPLYRCADPVQANDPALIRKLRSSWYSPSIHRASLAVPPAMSVRWPSFELDAEDCLESLSSGTSESVEEPQGKPDVGRKRNEEL